jgi:hypothetical protein
MFCPNCGGKCEENHRFCFRCGFALPLHLLNEDLPAPEEEAPAPVPVEETVEVPAEEIMETPAEEVMETPSEVLPAETVQEDPVQEDSEQVPAPECPQIPPVDPAPAIEAPQAPAIAAPQPKKGSLRVPLIILAAMMVLGMVLYFLCPTPPAGDADSPSSNSAVEGTPWFSVKDGVLSFNEALYTGNEELVIPETIHGQTVTVIGEDCFSGCDDLVSVILPETLKEIDNRAFSGCKNLRGIFIPEGVERIGSAAFANCLQLEAIHLPESLQILGDRALFRCPKLVHIFYAGTYENWKELYNGSMSNNTWVYCSDGKFPYERE